MTPSATINGWVNTHFFYNPRWKEWVEFLYYPKSKSKNRLPKTAEGTVFISDTGAGIHRGVHITDTTRTYLALLLNPGHHWSQKTKAPELSMVLNSKPRIVSAAFSKSIRK